MVLYVSTDGMEVVLDYLQQKTGTCTTFHPISPEIHMAD